MTWNDSGTLGRLMCSFLTIARYACVRPVISSDLIVRISWRIFAAPYH